MDKIREIAEVLARVRDPGLIEGFLRDILTPRERHDLSARWELVKRLEKGHSQRRISAELGLSLCKITRGARELKKTESALKKVLAVRARKSSGA